MTTEVAQSLHLGSLPSSQAKVAEDVAYRVTTVICSHPAAVVYERRDQLDAEFLSRGYNVVESF